MSLLTRFAGALATVSLAGVPACTDAPTVAPPAPQIVELPFQAAVAGTPVVRMTVEVSAADIRPSLLFRFAAENGIVSGTLQLPPGAARQIVVRGYDSSDVLVYEGAQTVDVTRAAFPPLAILAAKAPGGGGDGTGQVPITCTIGTATVIVSPAEDTLGIGDSRQLTAVVLASNGDTLREPVRWATTNPARATVDASGLLLARDTGEVMLVATYGGFGGRGTARVRTRFLQISAGEDHTCAVSVSGRSYCWGLNDHGQLGTGTTHSSQAPARVHGALIISQIDSGDRFTCALSADSKSYCWGDNSQGQLGTGTTSSGLVPVLVSTRSVFTKVATGAAHACGITGSGAVFCWGSNGFGQLGDGTTQNRSTPAAVSAGKLKFSDIDAGAFHTCALATDRTVHCWGDNLRGALGSGSGHALSTTPVRVSGTLAFTSLAAGEAFTCGMANGQAYCWGANDLGQLGSGTTTDSRTPVAVAGGLSFSSLASLGPRGAHTCGRSTSGLSFCWGSNTSGQLGVSGVSGSPNPVQVSSDFVFDALTAGANHSCAWMGRGMGYCWGANLSGQLGDGTSRGRASPGRILDLR